MSERTLRFESEFLSEVMSSFSSRSKSLKHKTKKLLFEKEVEEYDERLNVDVEAFSSPSFQIRLSLWSDGSAYFRTCQSAKSGWRHNIALNGFLGNCKAREIEHRFEQSLAVNTLIELQQLWPELAQC